MKAKTLKQFAREIDLYLKRHPEHADLPVLTARDDEGNGYNRVYFDPGHGTDWELGNGDTIEGVCVS